MNFESSAASIVTQLATGFTNSSLPFGSFRMPDSQKQYDDAAKSISNNGAAFIIYAGSSADRPNNTWPVSQLRKVQFNVECHCRNLYGLNGMYALQDAVEKYLVGFEPTNCNRLYLIKDDLNKTEDGIWIQLYQFECETMLVQDQGGDTIIGGNLTEVKEGSLTGSLETNI